MANEKKLYHVVAMIQDADHESCAYYINRSEAVESMLHYHLELYQQKYKDRFIGFEIIEITA